MKILVSILLLSIAATATLADTAERDAEFFHPAASLYIQGDATSASNLVAKGLSIYPEDGKLLRLKELLEQQQEQEQQQKDQQQQNEEQQNQEQNEEPQNQENQNQSDPNEEQQQPPEPQTAEQMSEDEAKQLLDAMRQEEQNKRMQLHPVLGRPVKVDKDW